MDASSEVQISFVGAGNGGEYYFDNVYTLESGPRRPTGSGSSVAIVKGEIVYAIMQFSDGRADCLPVAIWSGGGQSDHADRGGEETK